MLKKSFIIAFILFASVILYWCNESTWFRYEFENFYWFFDTENTFEPNKTELKWLWYELLQSSIIKMYTQTNDSYFTESIIISKKNSDKDVESFAAENIENVDISGLKLSKWKAVEADCNWNKYNLVYYQGKYSMNQYNIYLSEGFLKVNQDIFVISYATLDEKARNNFSSSFKTIKCN